MYERVRQWLREHRDQLDEYTVNATEVLDELEVYKSEDPNAIDFLIVSDDSKSSSGVFATALTNFRS